MMPINICLFGFFWPICKLYPLSSEASADKFRGHEQIEVIIFTSPLKHGEGRQKLLKSFPVSSLTRYENHHTEISLGAKDYPIATEYIGWAPCSLSS